MRITITGQPGPRITIAGDITTTLWVPYDEVEECFLLGGERRIADRRSPLRREGSRRFRVDGAGISRIGHGELTLDGRPNRGRSRLPPPEPFSAKMSYVYAIALRFHGARLA